MCVLGYIHVILYVNINRTGLAWMLATTSLRYVVHGKHVHVLRRSVHRYGTHIQPKIRIKLIAYHTVRQVQLYVTSPRVPARVVVMVTYRTGTHSWVLGVRLLAVDIALKLLLEVLNAKPLP
jgi:hypothetical protein